MQKCRLPFAVLAFGLALSAQAEVPVMDGSGSYGSYPVSNSTVGGAYVGDGASAPSSPQGELFMQLQQMQEEISQLRGMVEEHQNEIRRLKQEGLERYQDLDGRIQSLGTTGAAGGAVGGAINANATPTPPGADNASAEAGDPAKEKLYYEAAFDLIKAKDFAKATQAFNAFLRKYPNSQYAGNAQYWLGEVDLVNGDLQSAGKAFASVSQNYPSHSKVPDSLYKLADVERRLGNTEKAKTIWRQIVAQYPGSSAAQLAQQDLQR